MFNQVLVSKDEIGRKYNVSNVTLREIYNYCKDNHLRLIAVDNYFIIAEDLDWESRREGMLYEVYNKVSEVAKHFNSYY